MADDTALEIVAESAIVKDEENGRLLEQEETSNGLSC